MEKQTKKSMAVYLPDWETISKWAIEAQCTVAEIIRRLVERERAQREAEK